MENGIGITVTWYAVWEKNAATTYTLTLNANGGSVTPTSVARATGTAYTLPTPTRSGYAFTGWTLSGGGSLSGSTYTFGTSNGTVTAQWTANATSYTLTLNANGGSVTPTSVTQAQGTTYTLPTPTRSGYAFTGWTLSGGGSLSGSTYTFGTSNGAVTAQWTANATNYTLTLNANGGSVTPTSVTQAQGTTYTLPTPTRSNYTFTGWTLSGGGSLSGSTYTFGTSNGTVTAQWRTNVTNYTVTYNTDGGNPATIAPVTVASGTSITLPAAPTKNGNIFRCWKTGSTTLAAGASYTVTGNVTFTAQWATTIFNTKYEATFLNWILFLICFGWLWM